MLWLCRILLNFFLGGIGNFCQSVLAMKQIAPLDSYDNAVRTFGLNQSEYEELQELMNESADEAVSSFISDSDKLGYLSDLLETYGFETEQDSNKLVIRHPQITNMVIVRINNGHFTVGYLGEIISNPNESPQQTIGHILMIAPWIDRDAIFEDAKTYGWGLPTYRDTFKTELENEI